MKISQYREIPILGDTKGWFKRDTQTIRNSSEVTVRRIPLIILITFVLTCLIYYLTTSEINLFEILVYFSIFAPITIIAFFLLHVMKTKGYDITAP
jgi:hypothetical protein